MPFEESKYHFVRSYEAFEARLNSGGAYIACDRFQNNESMWLMLSQVRTSDLSGLGLLHRSFRGFVLTKAMYEELKYCKHLEELWMRALTLDVEGAEALGFLIQQNTHLLTLRLHSLRLQTISFLNKAMERNSTLKYLRLEYNVLTLPEEEFVHLAKILEENTSLTELWLQNTQIKDTAAAAFAVMLKRNVHLVSLRLYRCGMTSKGGTSLARSLVRNTTLQELDLSGRRMSPIDDDSARAFAQALGTDGNRTLRKLWLTNNKMHDKGLVLLESLLSVNNILEVVRISSRRHSVEEIRIRERINAILDHRKRERNKVRLEAFKRAKGSESTAPWLRSKLMVVGRGAAGKTNTVRSLLGLKLKHEWDSTIGIDLNEVTTSSGAPWKKEGRTDFATGFLHRLAVENMEEPHEVKRSSITSERNKLAKQSSKIKKVTDAIKPRGEKLDTKNREKAPTSKTETEETSFEYQEELFVSQERSKDAIRMSIWDYGGQTVFYTLHHLFLTQYGVYLIVFDLTKLLENVDDSSEYLYFWLNSIKLHAPRAPVILVGTFMDKLDNDIEPSEHVISSQLQQAHMVLQNICTGFDQVCAFEEFVYCPISNKTKAGVQPLRKAVERETNNADFVQTPVSLKWMQALDILVQSKDRSWIKVTDLAAELVSVGIERNEEVERMLCLFHELGVVLYFSSSVRLKEVVISKPEWLLRKLSLIIRDKDVHEYDRDKLLEVQLTEDLEYFLEKGIASRDLLEFLWHDRSQVDYLVELMRHMLLLSNWDFSQEEQYLIPSMLSTENLQSPVSGVQFYLEFEFLPQGVFERICCLCVGYSSSLSKTQPPRLYRTACIVDLGDKGLMQVEVKGKNIITVTISEAAAEARMLLDFFLSMIRRIQNDFMHGGLEWQVFVWAGEKFLKHKDAERRMLEPWVRKNASADSVALDKFLSS